MLEAAVHQEFIDWLGQTWWELPNSVHLQPIARRVSS
jgi:hypothetical protein